MKAIAILLISVVAAFAQIEREVEAKPDTIRWENYANGKRNLPKWADGQVYENCNFSQLKYHTKIGGGKKVTFVECNLKNCIIENGGKTEKCYQVGNHEDYCIHEHPVWAKRMEAEPIKCRHVIPESTIVIMDKGDTLAVQYKRKDIKVIANEKE